MISNAGLFPLNCYSLILTQLFCPDRIAIFHLVLRWCFKDFILLKLYFHFEEGISGVPLSPQACSLKTHFIFITLRQLHESYLRNFSSTNYFLLEVSKSWRAISCILSQYEPFTLNELLSHLQASIHERLR